MKSQLERLSGLFFVVSLFVVSALVKPGWVDTVPLCLFKIYTGLDCPGCGLSRGFVAFFHGHFRQAIFYNAMVPVLILSFSLTGVRTYYRYSNFRNASRWHWTSAQGQRWISRLFAVLFMGQWLAKIFWHLLH